MPLATRQVPLANHLSALPRIRHLIHISRLTPLPGQTPARPSIVTSTVTSTASKEPTVRTSPSDVLLIVLTLCLLLLTAFTLGGLAACPF